MMSNVPAEMRAEDLVIMGSVGAPFAIRGWVHVFADTEFPDSLFDYEVWWLGQGQTWRAYTIEEAQTHKNAIIVKFTGVDTREAAEALRKVEVAVPRALLPAPAEDEYYWRDLIGLLVFNEAGDAFGGVAELLESGAHDILVVRGDREHLIPFVRDIVLSVDPMAKRIVVRWELDY